MSGVILDVNSISKSYNRILALSKVGFELNKGDIFGLLGRNGGGKTTLIKILTSMISDYSGDITFLNHNLRDKNCLILFKSQIAYLPDKEFLYGNMSALECANFFQDFFQDFSKDKALEIFDRLEISPSKKINTMSKGQAEKVGIALILARHVALYILDEPLAGADIISRDEIFFMIKEYCSDNAAIIATHLISNVEPIINKAMFLNKKVMAYGSKNKLLEGFSSLEDSFRYYAGNHQIKPQIQAQDTV
ncbi:ABC transporter ATP-binding protein [Helicobacter muridarum]|uniref:ABC transporter n=1 Tax=Helicobacter muridarum TaxID=216 RepID=A0A099TX07_9HELI|nr:ABC transporter ATP-binding protein [Helicobacter muridarum]TLE00869.1 ABC transporter ATP-binding protein [Helicobacter muridarum]STQ86641.1 ABC transporter [Helicobacter muridarum]